MIKQNGVLLGRLRRWADRKGRTVRWGNVISIYAAQEFEEVFATDAQARERERQALACEAIGADREPVAIGRTDIGAWRGKR